MNSNSLPPGARPPPQKFAYSQPAGGAAAPPMATEHRPQVAFTMGDKKGAVAEGFGGDDTGPPAKQARTAGEGEAGAGAAGDAAKDASKQKGGMFVPTSEIDDQNPFADDPEGGEKDPQPVYGGVEEHLQAQQQAQWALYQQQQQQTQAAAQPRTCTTLAAPPLHPFFLL